MKILVTGATGFIASHIVSTLAAAGHEVVCCVRNVSAARRRFWYATVIPCDFNRDINIETWLERLQPMHLDAVINCVGVLQGGFKQNISTIHYDTPIALFQACQRLNVKRVIQLSALGAGEVDTEYSTTKQNADEYLLGVEGISALVVRPSVVHGSSSYGGTSLFRGLSALPFITPLVGKGRQLMSPVSINDLAEAMKHYVEHDEIAGQIIYAAGPEQVTQKKLLLTLRQWLGFGKSKCMSIPKALINCVAKLGDRFARSRINTTSMKMLEHNNIYDPVPFQQTLPFTVKGFTEFLVAHPSGTQDRWHARLYFIRPLLRYCLAFMWLVSGIVPFFNVVDSNALLVQFLTSHSWITTTRIVFSLFDIVLGVTVLSRWRVKLSGTLQFLLVFGYTLASIFVIPHQWLNPIGPLVKNITVLAVILTWMVLEDDR